MLIDDLLNTNINFEILIENVDAKIINKKIKISFIQILDAFLYVIVLVIQ